MTFFLLYWKEIALAALVLVLAGYGQEMRVQRNSIRAEFAEHKAAQAAAAVKQAREALAITVADERRKEAADDENARTRASDDARIRRLRASADDAASDFLSALAACSDGSEKARRYATDTERAHREFIAGLRTEGDRSTEAIADLNTAKRWAQSRP